MTDANQISESDELLHIYVTLRKLKCLTKDDHSLFPEKFLWKVLDERLGGLNELAGEICRDLFNQVGSLDTKHQAADESQEDATAEGESGGENKPSTNLDHKRYPEFDEYFHTCLSQMYDLIMELHWHSPLPGKTEQVTNMEHVDKFVIFHNELMSGSPQRAGGFKGRLGSPPVRRRVQFEEPSPPASPSSLSLPALSRKNQHQDNHSVFALELLLFGVDIFVQRLSGSLASWSAEVESNLNKQLDAMFKSKSRIRSRQLQVLAKTIKVHNDVHLTVLDYLSEIKRNYLVRLVRGTLLARDSLSLLENYKQSRVACYLQRLHTEAEVKILRALVRQCLQMLFDLIICEINVPPVELCGPKPAVAAARRQERRQRPRDSQQDQLVSVQQNVMNFIGSWLRVDDILFGVAHPKKPQTSSQSVLSGSSKLGAENSLKRPRIAAKNSSTLNDSNYKSSSRILAQMDNLGEFTREFLHTIVGRLSHTQQLGYFFDSISAGMSIFFDKVVNELEQQLRRADAVTTTTTNTTTTTDPSASARGCPEASLGTGHNIDSMAAKIRCLKFVHIMGSAGRIIADEAKRARVELEVAPRLEVKLAKFMTTCLVDGGGGGSGPGLSGSQSTDRIKTGATTQRTLKEQQVNLDTHG